MFYTIGHSTRNREEFLALLAAHGVDTVVDVRSYPGSAFVPAYGRGMSGWLREGGVEYTHLPALGGRRCKIPGYEHLNAAWRNVSFRNFADYMQTDDFEKGFHTLEAHANLACVAIMCSEAVPWRCHRNLIADAATARGIEVRHIISVGDAKVHTLSPMAHVDGHRVTYPLPLTAPV